MTARRSGSLMSRHAAISATDQQPRQSAETGSTTQIFTQGVEMSAAGMGVI